MKLSFHESLNSIGVLASIGLAAFALVDGRSAAEEKLQFIEGEIHREEAGVQLVSVAEEIDRSNRTSENWEGLALGCNCGPYRARNVPYSAIVTNRSSRPISIVQAHWIIEDRRDGERFADHQRQPEPSIPFVIEPYSSMRIALRATLDLDISEATFARCREVENMNLLMTCLPVIHDQPTPFVRYPALLRITSSSGRVYDIPMPSLAVG